MAPSLLVGSDFYDSDALAKGGTVAGASEQVQAALDFCRDWLRGDTSFLFHTSGSTGAPKPIALTRRQMEASVAATALALGLARDMGSLVCLPTRYVAGRMMLARGLVVGMNMVLVEPAADPLAGLQDSRVDFASFVPLQIETILGRGGVPALSRMHAILVGGAPVSDRLAAALRPLPAPIFHTYGMTETATHVALRRLSGPDASDEFVALPGVELTLDGRGCLLVNGPMTNDLWIATNDVVELRGADRFAWRGRADNIINSGGVKVQVEPLEVALEALLVDLAGEEWGERRYFAAGLPDARLGQIVTLVAEGSPLPRHTEDAVLAGLRRALGPFEAPRQLLYVPRFAETPTAKVDRAATLEAVRK